ncbi:MAG: hypothetical protein ABI559_12175 [Chloroflexota bacterium]
MVRTLIAAALFIAFAIALTLAARSHDADASGIQGDANCDLHVTITDALGVLQQNAGIASNSNGCDYNGDVNCDSANNTDDVLLILAYVAGSYTSNPTVCLPIGSYYQNTDTPTPAPTNTDGTTLSPPPGPTLTPTPTPTSPTILTTTPIATPVDTHNPSDSPAVTPTPTATPTAHTPTPTPTPKPPTNTPHPNQTPRFSGEPNCQVFPANNPWNTDISNLQQYPVDPNSDNYVDFIGRDTYLHPDVGTVWQNVPIGIPYAIVGGNQPKVPITYYYGDSDPGPYPIPSNVPVEGQPVGSPNTANFGGDRHVIVIDDTNCKLYETFDSHPVNNGQSWTTGSAAIFDLNSNALRPDTWTSADAAGLPIFPGLIRYDEVMSGTIDHALRFTVHDTQHAFIHPATHEASDNYDTDAPPMGLRFRMKASFDCSHYSTEVITICNALKKYGMFVADNGSDWYISGAPDNRWDDDHLGDLKTITGDAFEVVDTGENIIVPPPDN